MRNPNRIDEFCRRLAAAWKHDVPDWRFGQLMSNLFSSFDGRDPFFIEDDEMIDLIESYLTHG